MCSLVHSRYTKRDYDTINKVILDNKEINIMLKRRTFLILGSLLGLSSYIDAKKNSSYSERFHKVESTIEAVQNHMFPQGSKLPSARQMKTIRFLYETMMHPSFDKDIKRFVLEGAETLAEQQQEDFVSLSRDEKEKALRTFEESNYGSSWLSRIMTLTMEGLFSDPIYGANQHEEGWKAIGAYGGIPRPKERYLANV